MMPYVFFKKFDRAMSVFGMALWLMAEEQNTRSNKKWGDFFTADAVVNPWIAP
jgi:hypothetical protein